MNVRVREPVASGEDDFGNVVETWEERDWAIRSIAPGAMEEPGTANRDYSVVVWTIYSDAGDDVPDENAQVRLPGSPDWYAVDGRPRDWTFGPSRVGPSNEYPLNPPGAVTELRRVNG